MKSKKEIYKNPVCVVCGSKATVLIYKAKKEKFNKIFRYFKCTDCEHLFVEPVLSQEELFEDYSYELKNSDGTLAKSLTRLLVNNKFYERAFSSKKYIKRIIRRHIKEQDESQGKPITYLDFGSGNSKNLMYFRAIEPNSICFGYEKSRSARYIKKDRIFVDRSISNISKRTYDIITLFHVLEHIVDLDAFFRLLRKISTSSTSIIFQIPNSQSLDVKLLKRVKSDFILHTPYHLNIFSRESLKILANKYGFNIKATEYNIYQIHSLIMDLNFIAKLILTPFMLLISVFNSILNTSNYFTVYLEKE